MIDACGNNKRTFNGCSYFSDDRLMQKQLAYMLGRQQIFLELSDDVEEYDELTEIMSNANLNNNFMALAREVGSL